MSSAAVKKISAYAAIFVLWGLSFLAIREVVRVCPPFLAAAVRFIVAGSALTLFAFGRGMRAPTAVEWRNVAMLGVLLFVGDYAGLFWAEKHIASGLAAVISATIPAIVVLLEWLWLRRGRPSALTIVGVAVGLAGVVLLLLPAQGWRHGLVLDRYCLVALVSAFCWALGTVWSTRLTLPRARPVSAGLQMLIGGVALLALSFVAGEMPNAHITLWDARAAWSMAYLIVGASLLAFSAYVYLLSIEPAGRVASYAYVNPVIALAAGTGLAGERLTPAQVVASGIVIAGVFSTWLGRQRPARASG